MLRELHISHLAVIEDACIELGQGLNCFTGQTGAGKSLVMGALEMLLGLRAAGNDMLRPGANEARVSGLFELHDPWLAQEVSQAAGVPIGAGDELLIARRLSASGRSSVTINGQLVTAAMVRSIGQLLVDVHGRHDHQYLLKPSNQLLVMDSFGHHSDLREQFRQAHATLRALESQRAERSGSRTLHRQQLELYEFQAHELDAAGLTKGEFPELKARHRMLSNLSRLKRDAGAAHAAMYESEGSIVERLHMVARLLGDLSELDSDLSDVAEHVRTATLTLQESAFEVGRYTSRMDLNPGELEEVEDRINTLNRLLAKYGNMRSRSDDGGGSNASAPVDDDDPVTGLVAYRDRIEGEIQRLRGQDADLSSIDREIGSLRQQLAQIGVRLSAGRRRSAQRLKPLVESELRELGMADVRFDVTFQAQADTDPATGSATGLDRIEMLVQTNPGQPARPLRKIASSGELSRIMLALKSILAHSDRISVLVFDEIDANIGGRMGTVIGTKLRGLSRSRPGHGAGCGHQVVCITHLPQIAAFADRHLHISKSVSGKGKAKKTHTQVCILDGRARVEEMAQMLAGRAATDTTRRQVHEMLASAAG